MNPRISHLISHPFESGADDVPALQDEIDKYPYFSTLRLLMLFGLKEHDHPSFQEELKLAAIQSPSRTALYHYLQKERQLSPTAEEKTPETISTPEESGTEEEVTAEEITTEEITAEKAEVTSVPPHADTTTPSLPSSDPKTEEIPERIESSELTFSQWLHLAGQTKTAESSSPTEKEIKYRLIDEFIEKAPKISPVGKEGTPDPAKPRADMAPEYSDLMTETLAQIYLEQKKYDKAIRAYKILGLKYPDKKEIFSEKIKEVENMRDAR